MTTLDVVWMCQTKFNVGMSIKQLVSDSEDKLYIFISPFVVLEKPSVG